MLYEVITAFLDPFHRTVGLPGTPVADRLVEVDDLATLLAGLDALRLLPLWTGAHFVGFGEGKISQTDAVRCGPRITSYNVCYTKLLRVEPRDFTPILSNRLRALYAQ